QLHVAIGADVVAGILVGAPVVAAGRAAARPLDHADARVLEGLDDVVAHPVGVGDRRAGADEQAAVPVLAQPLHQQAVDAVADGVLRGVGVDGQRVGGGAAGRPRAGVGDHAAGAGASGGAARSTGSRARRAAGLAAPVAAARAAAGARAAPAARRATGRAAAAARASLDDAAAAGLDGAAAAAGRSARPTHLAARPRVRAPTASRRAARALTVARSRAGTGRAGQQNSGGHGPKRRSLRHHPAPLRCRRAAARGGAGPISPVAQHPVVRLTVSLPICRQRATARRCLVIVGARSELLGLLPFTQRAARRRRDRTTTAPISSSGSPARDPDPATSQLQPDEPPVAGGAPPEPVPLPVVLPPAPGLVLPPVPGLGLLLPPAPLLPPEPMVALPPAPEVLPPAPVLLPPVPPVAVPPLPACPVLPPVAALPPVPPLVPPVPVPPPAPAWNSSQLRCAAPPNTA